LLALGVGGFSLGTGEFGIMGLLPEVARDVGITIPAAGHLISAYALGVVIGAPLLAVLCARWPRRALLIALMGFCALANFVTALVPGYLAVGLVRFAAGLPHGAYFGVAVLVGAALAPPHQRGRAVGFVMLGMTTAMLIGAPLAAWLGQQFGWRAAFIFVGLVAVLAALLIRYSVPNLPLNKHASPMRELSALARPQIWLTLAISYIGFGGLFCVFSFIKPTLVEVSGLGIAQVPLVLTLFGAGGVAGTLIGARLADRALMPTIGGALIYSAAVLACFGTLAQYFPTALVGVFLLGSLVVLGPAL
jgi:MFS transporter, DHA1 family, inner membrane transport protein